MPKAVATKSRWWTGSWNNPPKEWPQPLPDWVRAVVYQLEEAPTTGTPHFQWTMQLHEQARFSKVKKYLKAAHIEAVRSIDACIDYAQKKDSRLAGPWQIGNFVKDGARTDLMAAKQLIDKGATELQVAEAAFETWAQNYNALNRYRLLKAPRRTWLTEVHVLWGPPGSGKSRRVRELAPDAFYKNDGDWWDSYDGQEDVVLDDFYGKMQYATFLKLCDRYELKVEVKGGTVQMLAKRIFITSNKHPTEWYAENKCYEEQAVLRRMTTITHVQTWDDAKAVLASGTKQKTRIEVYDL